VISWVLDTNVLSEPTKIKPDPGVLEWLGTQSRLVTTAVTIYELTAGIERLTSGKRRRVLEAWMAALVEAIEVLPFDRNAALAAAKLEHLARKTGRSVEHRDLFILATAHAQNCGVATRNVDHFQGLAVSVFDPFAGR